MPDSIKPRLPVCGCASGGAGESGAFMMENNLNFTEGMSKQSRFGEKLRILREIYDVSQQEIADLLGIERSTYTYYELGKTEPSLGTLRKIAYLFHVSADFLLDIPGTANQELQRCVDHIFVVYPEGRKKP